MLLANIFWILLGLSTSLSQTTQELSPGDHNNPLTAGDLAMTFDREMQVSKSGITTKNTRGKTGKSSETFPAGIALYANVEEGASVDKHADESFAGIEVKTDRSFHIAGIPSISSTKPVDNATTASASDNLEITFSEPVKAAANKNITIYQNGTALSPIAAANTGIVSINGATVTINPSADFTPGAAVYVQIESGAFLSVATNDPFAGITNATTWNFTVAAPDTQAPTASLSPINGATNVAITESLVLTFNEAVQRGTGTITITQGSTTQTFNAATSTAITLSADNKTVTINPADFPNATVISVTVPSGAFKDLANNAFAGTTGSTGTTPWSFTTVAAADNTPPTASSFTPGDNATGVAANTKPSITFSEPVRKGNTGNITLNVNGTNEVIPVNNTIIQVAGSTLTINRSGDFPTGASVYITLDNGVITDLNNNAYAGISNITAWNFTVAGSADNTAPKATLDPQHNATGVAISQTLSLTFDEPVRKGSGSITVSYGSTTNSIPLSSVTLSADNRTASFDPTPSGDFPNGATVSVTVPNTAFEDLAGNKFNGTGGSSGTPWSFTTVAAADNTPPTISVLDPLTGATSVATTQNLKITFSEKIKKGTGTITLYYNNVAQSPIPVTASTVSISADALSATIDPATDLPHATPVAVRISSGAFTDLANNAFAGIDNNTTWSFTTAAPPDTQAPGLTTRTPMHNATNVAISENLVLVFDEAIQAGTGNISITDGTTPQSISVTDASRVSFSADKKTVTINPLDFANSATVAVTIPSGAFTDLASTPNALPVQPALVVLGPGALRPQLPLIPKLRKSLRLLPLTARRIRILPLT